MAKPLRPAVLLLSGLTLVLFLAGCPKRPMTNIASAPAPTTPPPTVSGPAAPPPAATTAPSAPPSIAPRPATPAPGTPPKASVSASRIQIDSYDSDQPICPEKTEACAAKSRRVHFCVKPQ